jgi:hypothetical protein
MCQVSLAMISLDAMDALPPPAAGLVAASRAPRERQMHDPCHCPCYQSAWRDLAGAAAWPDQPPHLGYNCGAASRAARCAEP